MTTADVQLWIAARGHRRRDAILGDVKWVPEKKAFDEAFDKNGAARQHYRPLVSILESFTQGEIERRERLQKLSLMDQGITFTVYGEKEGTERIFPPEIVLSRKEYKRELLNVIPPRQIFTHVVGTDIIRNDAGEYLVLEDNCRCPSGVSYVLENRNTLNRVFPEFFKYYPVRPIKDYPTQLLDALLHAAPRFSEKPVVVILTPGMANSAYFEHSFLAREMGVVLVEGRDLIVEDNYVL